MKIAGFLINPWAIVIYMLVTPFVTEILKMKYKEQTKSLGLYVSWIIGFALWGILVLFKVVNLEALWQFIIITGILNIFYRFTSLKNLVRGVSGFIGKDSNE